MNPDKTAAAPHRNTGAAQAPATIVSVNIANTKGERKQPVGSARLKTGFGLVGDGHAGSWHRQVSLLAMESIVQMREIGLEVGPGDFAENLTIAGIDLPRLPIGTRLRLGHVLLEITQLGKECHEPCEIFRQAGDCVMPREGVFARVLAGGKVSEGDTIVVARESALDAETLIAPGNQ